jgi:hypothetical protein
MVNELETVFGTEGADENVYGLPDGHAFRPEKTVVGRRLFGDAETHHVELREREKKARHFAPFPWWPDALHDLAVDKVANADKTLIETQIDFVGDSRQTSAKILDPRRRIDYDHFNPSAFLPDHLPRWSFLWVCGVSSGC